MFYLFGHANGIRTMKLNRYRLHVCWYWVWCCWVWNVRCFARMTNGCIYWNCDFKICCDDMSMTRFVCRLTRVTWGCVLCANATSTCWQPDKDSGVGYRHIFGIIAILLYVVVFVVTIILLQFDYQENSGSTHRHIVLYTVIGIGNTINVKVHDMLLVTGNILLTLGSNYFYCKNISLDPWDSWWIFCHTITIQVFDISHGHFRVCRVTKNGQRFGCNIRRDISDTSWNWSCYCTITIISTSSSGTSANQSGQSGKSCITSTKATCACKGKSIGKGKGSSTTTVGTTHLGWCSAIRPSACSVDTMDAWTNQP